MHRHHLASVPKVLCALRLLPINEMDLLVGEIPAFHMLQTLWAKKFNLLVT